MSGPALVLLALLVSTTGSTGLPTDLPRVVDTIDATSRTVVLLSGAPAPATPPRSGPWTTDPAWTLLQQAELFERIGVGQTAAVRFDAVAGSLVPVPPPDPLTARAGQAVQRAPTWLRKQLTDQFSRMSGAASQDRWADEILNATDPYVDETAFLVAHLSKDDLQNAAFHAQLVRDSARYAYDVDTFLDYVTVVDRGSAAEGGDYDTHLRYGVELDGVVTAVDYPREFYYWWVISPRGSDEFPAYIDPVPCSSGGTVAPPPTGKFWREWLWSGPSNKFGGQCDADWDGAHDDPCPSLRTMLSGVPVLWRHLANTSGPSNGAVGVVNDWVRQSIGPFGDRDGCRPVQPVTVYYHGDGNCGEWADLTLAAGRAALLPTEVTGTQVNDHVWNEFFDAQWARWIQWEPVNNMIDATYSGWWGGKIAATHTHRGDGWGHTERTAQHGPSATLTVTVYDAHHYPVDGARVTLASEYDPLPIYLMSASLGHTDDQGQVVFTLGDSRNYYVQVATPWGTYPASGYAKVVSNAVGGTSYAWSPPDFSGSVSRLAVSPDSSPGTLDDHLLEAEWRVDEGLVHGGSFVSASLTYTREHPGDVDFFVADAAGWSQFKAGSPFPAFAVALDDPGRFVSFVPPEPGDYTLAWNDTANVEMAEVVSGTVRLYVNNGSVPGVVDLGADRDAAGGTQLDWGDVAGWNVDGYNVYRSSSAADVGDARDEAQLAPFLLGFTPTSSWVDPEIPPAGGFFFYSVRTHSRRGGISP